MNASRSGRITALYSLIQSIYWMCYGLMFNYASSYLQSCGFSDGRIGLVLGLTYLLSALLQPVFARVVEKTGLPLNSAMSSTHFLIMLLSLLLWLDRKSVV